MWLLVTIWDGTVLELRKPFLCSLTPWPSTNSIITKIILAQNILFGDARIPLNTPGYYTHSSLRLFSAKASGFYFVLFSHYLSADSCALGQVENKKGRVTSAGSNRVDPGSAPLCPFPVWPCVAMWPWAIPLTSLSLCFSICGKGGWFQGLIELPSVGTQYI